MSVKTVTVRPRWIVCSEHDGHPADVEVKYDDEAHSPVSLAGALLQMAAGLLSGEDATDDAADPDYMMATVNGGTIVCRRESRWLFDMLVEAVTSGDRANQGADTGER